MYEFSFIDNYFYYASSNTLLYFYGYHILIPSRLFYMSKKISKKASAIRTISLAIGSLSLLFIAAAQYTDNEVCTSKTYLIGNQISLS